MINVGEEVYCLSDVSDDCMMFGRPQYEIEGPFIVEEIIISYKVTYPNSTNGYTLPGKDCFLTKEFAQQEKERRINKG